jgi:hypothetical protein
MRIAEPAAIYRSTQSGAESHARKNRNASEALFLTACLLQDPGALNTAAEAATPRR